MNKWLKQGLLYASFFAVFSFMVGCSLFGGLDDAQKTAATYVNTFFAKSDSPSAEQRYEKIVSLVSSSFKNGPTQPEYKSTVIQFIQKFMQNGLNKEYYIADSPNEPQTDTRRTIVIRFPKDSFASANMIFGDGVASKATKESYGTLVLTKEGDTWKIVDMKDGEEKILQKADIDWKKVNPTDYLD